jgi:hypothetical protein
MQNAVIEILRLVADGAIRPEEGQELLDALRAGYPEEFDRPVATRPLGPVPSAPSPESSTDRRSIRSVLGAGVGSSGSDGSTDDADPWPGSSPQQPTAAAADATTPYLQTGDVVEIPSGVLLRIDTAGPSRVTDGPMSSVAIRGVAGQLIRVVRGSGAELHREDETAWRLTWPGGLLLLEIPERLAGLEIRDIPGSVGLSGYAGPFSVEEIGDGFTVHGASAPFRIREVGGAVQLHRLALRDGISTIAAVGQDVEIETAGEASITIRASSRAEAQDRTLDFDARNEIDPDRGGRRGVWRVGAGTAQLNVSQVHGQLRLHSVGSMPKDVP